MVPPCGAMVGVMPLKVIGPPVTMVMVPMTNPESSALGVATMVTFDAAFVLFFCAGAIAVGIVSGAVYTATLGLLVSGVMVPQVGLQEGSLGKFMKLPLLSVLGTFWVTSQVVPWF